MSKRLKEKAWVLAIALVVVGLAMSMAAVL